MNCAWTELLGILPLWLRDVADRQYRQTLQEIRLRIGMPAVLVHSSGKSETGRIAAPQDLQYVVNMACRYSPWTAFGAAQGYITAPGGHRVGLCGEAVIQAEHMTGLRTVHSVNIRVARDFPGIARALKQQEGSVLVLGRPGSGKTTLLRDLIRQLSYEQTVSVVDERGELFPLSAGKYCFDRGQAVDILTGCGKRQGVDAIIRTMTPDTLAVDEITTQEDCLALQAAGWCGVRLLATAHASSRADLLRRSVYRPLVETGLFDTLVILQPDKRYHTERI